jgi:hypothetical protein
MMLVNMREVSEWRNGGMVVDALKGRNEDQYILTK